MLIVCTITVLVNRYVTNYPFQMPSNELRPNYYLLWLILLFASVGSVNAINDSLNSDALSVPSLPVDKIRIGMKGYGLTVFHGAVIEPFAVEVVSVMRDFSPNRDLIWIICPEPRMQHSGPVQGMSGSPIYLWDDGTKHELGEGGKLIGAFAWGYPGIKTCYVGVQPIDLMRQVAERARAQSSQDTIASQGRFSRMDLGRMLHIMRQTAQSEGLRKSQFWQLNVLAALFPDNASGVPRVVPPPPPVGLTGPVSRLQLPIALGSAELARALRPLLKPVGIAPLATNVMAGKPPPGVDPQSIRLEPGSVVNVPLLWGDLDIYAMGTCTEVLPDGRMLAFGHPMFNQGAAAFPMATGYVHFIVPNRNISFKLGGSAIIQPGAIVRDEASAVASAPHGKYSTASMRVDVTMPDQSEKHFNYTLIKHRFLTPLVAALGGFRSMEIDRGMPLDNTLHARTTMNFNTGRRLQFDMLMPDGSPIAIAFALMAPLTTMANNPFESVMLDQVHLEVGIEAVNRSAQLVHARTDKLNYAPSDFVGITITYQPYHRPRRTERIMLQLPDTLPDGRYNITVAAAQQYIQHLLKARPHLGVTQSVDDVEATLKRIYNVQSNALYVIMKLPQAGLAIGRQELPKLPSSRRALFSTATSTPTTPFIDWVQKKVILDVVPDGESSAYIRVSKDLSRQ